MRILTLLFSFLLFALALPSNAQDRLLVFAPSSLTDVLGEIGIAFEQSKGTKIVFSFAGSSALSRQFDQGAPVDLFITANELWMNWVTQRNLVEHDSISVIAQNRLVLAVRNEIENWADSEALVAQERFAMADPESVPAGRYGMQALKTKGLWQKAKVNAVYGENVRIALRRLALGEVASALVYSTDVRVEPRVKTLFTFPLSSHDPIEYYAAITATKLKSSKEFLWFLSDKMASKIWKKHGFLPPAGIE